MTRPAWMLAYEDEIADLLRAHEQQVRERLAGTAATATIIRNADESLTLSVDHPQGAEDWVPVSLGVLADLPGAYNDGLSRARADERERIAQAIEAGCVHAMGTGEACYRCRHAARIARNGGAA